MSDHVELPHLSNHHRETLQKIFQHPVSHNLEWREVISLLNAVGTVEERHDDRYAVTIGEDSQVFLRPKHKDVDVEVVLELRRMLRAEGYGPAES